MKPIIIWWGILVLWLAIVAGAGWLAYDKWIAPLAGREANARRHIAELWQKMLEGQGSLKKARNLAQEVGEARDEASQMYDARCQGPSIVWLPMLLRDHFERFGLATPVARLVTTRDSAATPGYRRSYWSLSMPLQEGSWSVHTLLVAVRQLEQSERFVKVEDLVYRAGTGDLGESTAVLSISALVRE